MNINRGLGFPVRDCGRSEADIPDWNSEIATLTTELTEEEKKSKYAKYYYRGIKLPTAENLRQCEMYADLDASEAFMPEDYTARMTPENMDRMRTGYCLLENGIGYSVAKVPMQDISDEDITVFHEHYVPEDDLFYKSWFPGLHMRHYQMMCVEDVGLGMELVKFMSFIPPQGMGITEITPCVDDAYICMNGLNGVSWPLHTPYKHSRYVLETCFFRKVSGGREAIIHFWHGISWDQEKKQHIRRIPQGEKVNIQDVRAQVNHAVWEFTQAGELIRTFCDDYKNGRI